MIGLLLAIALAADGGTQEPLVGGPGALGTEDIRATIQKHRDDVRYCYEQESAKRRDLRGKVELHLVIHERGNVSDVVVGPADLPSAVQTCVRERVKKWVFAPPRNRGVVKVSYPFIFD